MKYHIINLDTHAVVSGRGRWYDYYGVLDQLTDHGEGNGERIRTITLDDPVIYDEDTDTERVGDTWKIDIEDLVPFAQLDAEYQAELADDYDERHSVWIEISSYRWEKQDV